MSSIANTSSAARWWLLRLGIPLTVIIIGLCAAFGILDRSLVRETVDWQGRSFDLRIYEMQNRIYVSVSGSRGLSIVSFLANADSVDSSDAEIVVDQDKGEALFRCDTARAVFYFSSRMLIPEEGADRGGAITVRRSLSAAGPDKT